MVKAIVPPNGFDFLVLGWIALGALAVAVGLGLAMYGGVLRPLLAMAKRFRRQHRWRPRRGPLSTPMYDQKPRERGAVRTDWLVVAGLAVGLVLLAAAVFLYFSLVTGDNLA
jgi:hypothetical protein